jgi:hypothetical protein
MLIIGNVGSSTVDIIGGNRRAKIVSKITPMVIYNDGTWSICPVAVTGICL